MAANLLAGLIPLLDCSKDILLNVKIGSICSRRADDYTKILRKYACSNTLEALFLLIGANLLRKEDL